MRQDGPHRTHQIVLFGRGLYPQVTRCSRPSAARLISDRTGTRRYGDVVLTFQKHF